MRIDQNIYTGNPSQQVKNIYLFIYLFIKKPFFLQKYWFFYLLYQKILIGANGTVIKTIGVRAATKLSAVFGKTVRLYLTVKVKIRTSY